MIKTLFGSSYKTDRYNAIIAAFVVTVIFSLRWSNSLPFSGYAPALDDIDTLGFMGRYLVFAREPFEFPFGTIKGLSFPFESAHISRGAVPLFALLFKALGQAYSPFLSFNYFVFAELVGVFITGYFACRLLSIISVKGLWPSIVVAVFVALSPGMLYRSSEFYNETFVFLNFPFILMFAYAYIRLFQHPEQLRYRILLPLTFILVALVDIYLSSMACILFVTALFISIAYAYINDRRDFFANIRVVFVAGLLGFVVILSTFALLGNQSNFETPKRTQLFEFRTVEGQVYGGGLGGGYHVADLFSVFLSRAHEKAPDTLASYLGVDFIDRQLQPGQYEGYAYIGFIPTILILAWLLKIALSQIRKLQTRTSNISTQPITLWKPQSVALAAVATGALALYIISWGYLPHVLGVRLNNILGPSALIAFIEPDFMYARALGRFAIAFTLLLTLFAGWFVCTKFLEPLREKASGAVLMTAVSIAIIAFSLIDIARFLAPPEQSVQGNEIRDILSKQDAETLKQVVAGKNAIMLVPQLLDNLPWNRVGFSLAYNGGIPISGATLGFAESPAQLRHYERDVSLILEGSISEILRKYGPVAIAAPSDYADTILAASDTALTVVKLQSQDVTILLPKGNNHE